MGDNINPMQVANYFYEICKQSSCCKVCPMVGGRKIFTGIGHIVCETGKNKKVEPK